MENSIELNREASSVKELQNNNTVEREICITCCAQLDTLSKLLKEQNMHLYKLTKAVIHNNVKNKSFTCPNCSASSASCSSKETVDESPRPAEIENKEALDNFERLLSDKSNFIATAKIISNSLASVTPENRMNDAVIKLFSATFLCKCSWLGGGKSSAKIPMGQY